MKWQYKGDPSTSGWYAVLVCYDPLEGSIPMGAWWDGGEWKQRDVVAFGDSRPSQGEAEDLAYEHDPEA